VSNFFLLTDEQLARLAPFFLSIMTVRASMIGEF